MTDEELDRGSANVDKRGVQTQVGPIYNVPVNIIAPRLLKLGVNINF